MRGHSHNDLRRWYKQLFELAPEVDVGEGELRWSIAYWLAKVCDNYRTAAHVIADLRWDYPAHRERLVECSSAIRSAVLDKPTEEVFTERMSAWYNASAEDESREEEVDGQREEPGTEG